MNLMDDTLENDSDQEVTLRKKTGTKGNGAERRRETVSLMSVVMHIGLGLPTAKLLLERKIHFIVFKSL